VLLALSDLISSFAFQERGTAANIGEISLEALGNFRSDFWWKWFPWTRAVDRPGNRNWHNLPAAKAKAIDLIRYLIVSIRGICAEKITHGAFFCDDLHGLDYLPPEDGFERNHQMKSQPQEYTNRRRLIGKWSVVAPINFMMLDRLKASPLNTNWFPQPVVTGFCRAVVADSLMDFEEKVKIWLRLYSERQFLAIHFFMSKPNHAVWSEAY